jgi:putative hydrolase of the HAD superfamily
MTKSEQFRYMQLIRDSSIKELEPLPAELPSEWEPLAVTCLPPAIKAVLFDIYGTLFISTAGEISAGAEPAAVAPSSNASVPANAADGTAAPELLEMRDYFRRMVNQCHEKTKARGIAWPEVTADKIWAQYKGKLPPLWGKPKNSREIAVRYELAVNPVFPMPHALDAINELADRNKILGIISNAQFYTPLLFHAFFNNSPKELGFDSSLLIYSYKEKEAKPSLRLFEKAKTRLANQKIAPEETLYVGNDMRNDIEPAARAGFKTALFAGDRRSLRVRDKKTTPDYIIKDLQALIHSR